MVSEVGENGVSSSTQKTQMNHLLKCMDDMTDSFYKEEEPH